MRRAAVVGAGISGLAAALLLARRGWEVEVHEAAEQAGGLLRPFRFRGVPCDLGSHRLHPAALRAPLLGEVAGQVPLARRPRRGRIVLRGRHLPYPLTLPGLLRGLGLRTSLAFLRGWLLRRGTPFAGWERARARPPAPELDEGFEDFVVARVGRAAYDGFYRPYAEKVWGIDPAHLSRTVAKQRVSSSRPGRQLAAAMVPRRGQTFLYPTLGMGAVVTWLESAARAAGAMVRYGSPVHSAGALDADAVITTAPLPGLAAAAGLSHRGLYLVFLALDVPSLGGVDTWYLPEGRFPFGRVSQVQNFSPALGRTGETVLCVEIPQGARGPTQRFDRGAQDLVEQLRAARIVPPRARLLEAAQRYVPDVYPMLSRGWLPRWRAALTEVVSDERTIPAGRQGLFLHCNIDHCLDIASDAAAWVADRRPARGWAAQAETYLGLRVRD